MAYADTAVTLLLPELEKGLFDDNWRIRYSSVQLLGKVLFFVFSHQLFVYFYLSFVYFFQVICCTRSLVLAEK